MFGLGIPELILIVIIAVIVFGASPKIFRKVGRTINELKRGLKEEPEEEKKESK